MAKGWKGGSVQVQMAEIMADYDLKVRDAVDASGKEAAEVCVKQLKSTSPKRPKHGEYARSWAVKEEQIGTGVTDYIVYNKKHYQLTHLLENGHMIRNKYGTYGRARPRKHIGPAADSAIQRYELACRARIRSIK